MALELRQKHLDAKLQVKDRPVRAFQESLGGTSGPGPGGWGRYDGPQFSGRLEDLREFRRCWDEYERQYYPKEPVYLAVCAKFKGFAYPTAPQTFVDSNFLDCQCAHIDYLANNFK
jgi:hypothetical protein